MARLALVLAVALRCSVAWAAATDEEAAKTHYFSAQSYFNGASYENALREFSESYRLSKHAAILYNIGLCQERLDRYAEAIATLEQYLAEEPGSARRVTVEDLLKSLHRRLDRQRATPTPPPVAASVAAPPASAPARDSRWRLEIALGAVAIASLAAGGGLYGSAAAGFPSLQESCSRRACTSSDWSGSQSMANAGYALLAVGGAVAVVDVALLIVDGRRRSRERRAIHEGRR